MSDDAQRDLLVLQEALSGRYSLERELGRGGMGVVYLAEQLQPVRRTVALKVIEPGRHSDEISARFETERQALAVMDHPSIAKVFEAGVTSDGHSWFAMEHVDGVGITDFCDQARQTVEERLHLFMRVCHAVQHAHQKGLIHRDIKPSNVLVTEVDGSPVPKIIDFGIAKVEDAGSFVGERLTQADQVIGTPAYMSPEQIDGSADIDTRSDVYSLGVLLYQLLSGALPHDSAAYRGWASLAAALHRTPPSPAQRVSDLADTQQTVAANRSTTPAVLKRTLRGDLDFIVARSMETDREHRYGTASGLATDIERFLASMPVRTSGASATYLLGKFARRHAVGVAVSGVISLLVVGFAAMMTAQARAIARERDRAELEAVKSSAVNEFMTATLLAPDPIGGLGRDVTVVEALSGAVAQLDSAFAGQPALEAAAASAIGQVLFQLGRYDEAEPLLRRAMSLQSEDAGRPSSDLAAGVQRWAALHEVRGQFDSAEVLYRRAIHIRREELGQSGSLVAEPLKALGMLLSALGRDEEGEAALRDALQMVDPTGDSLRIADLRNQIGVALWNQGKLDELEELWTSVLVIRRSLLGSKHPLVAEILNNLAVFYDNTGRPEDAEPLYREALELQRQLLGNEHEEVAAAAGNLAILLDVRGEYEEAEALYREALAIDRGQFGSEHPTVGNDLINLGSFECVTERPRRGLSSINEALRIYESTLEAGHWRLANALNWRGVCFRAMNDFDAAEKDWVEAYTLMSAALGDEHYRTDAIRARLVDLFEVTNRPESAARYRR